MECWISQVKGLLEQLEGRRSLEPKAERTLEYIGQR